VSSAFDHLNHRPAAMRGGGDVEKHHFVRALLVIAERECDGVADIAKLAFLGFAELDAARDLAGVNVQARNHSFGNHASIKGGVAPEGKRY
jgi:hypothetical protein